ncbi:MULTISPECIES: hypothetical protein [Legionella]|uniref:Transglutaminase-like domain-containing protein n=1 Tax=Legionella drozanskii LLAP-1 TaxID=1212489 RepID=A0A0W0SWE6_9GAMM|nr:MULTISPECIES: hypothetical protein [Legionella]KTC87695.1 hypothetical protein Ldro_1314 [Legionella drozanskii LLAP-1]PJE16229.1 MAG: hypothetical protein CK430_03350 [Legionella sp.]
MKEKYTKIALSACDHVHEQCPWGSTNRDNSKFFDGREEAIRRLNQTNRDQRLAAIEEKNSEEAKFKIVQLLALIAREAGAGNCQEMAALAFLYLREQGITHLELVSIPTHNFVVLGRDTDTPINAPQKWNKEAIICDPWRRKFKFDGEGFFFKNRMVLSPERLLKKLGEDCENLTVGFSMRDTPGFK